MKTYRKLPKMLLIALLTLSLTLPAFADTPETTGSTVSTTATGKETETLAFSDISGHWAEEVITKWKDKGIVNGYPDGTFKPDAPITRAELAKILSLAFELETPEEPKTFGDVAADSWYSGYVASTADYIPTYCPPDLNEQTRPYEAKDSFLPDNTALRIHAAGAFAAVKIAHDGLTIEYPSIQDINKTVTGKFSDAEFQNLYVMHGSVADNVKKLQTDAWLALELGLMQGDPAGNFRPYDSLTRAEVLTILDRCTTE